MILLIVYGSELLKLMQARQTKLINSERPIPRGSQPTDITLMYSNGSMHEDGDENNRTVGWGIVGYHLGYEVFKDRGGLGQKAEVYDMELTGITQGMKAAKEYVNKNDQVKYIHIYADNTAAVTLAYEPKPKPGQLQMIHTTYWCPGHEDVKGNERADEEAKAGVEIWTQDYTTLTNAKRTVKEGALERWKREWQKSPPTGGFAIANRLEPRWKPREHVTHAPREVFSRLTQCQTKHAFLGEYYAKFIPNESNRCTCEDIFQTREHVIKECPKHERHRDILREVDAQLELGILLGTKKGLEALAKFLAKTGAFTKTGEIRKQKQTPEEEDEENEEEEERW
ncbi:hypothetical protein E4T56_gene6078 [Termitomyces sp. T112]|nr:hypothetical protein E4T56_gene6078 [Termitomyces sp. T112]